MSAFSSPPATGSRWVLPFLGAVTFLTAIGNIGLVSVMPAIGRMLRIPDFLVAGIFSVSALTWAVSSPFWVSRIGRAGPAFYIRAGLVGSVQSCAVSIDWNHGWIAGTPFEEIDDLILYDFAVHWFELLASLIGDRATSVYATKARASGQTVRPPVIGDNGSAFPPTTDGNRGKND